MCVWGNQVDLSLSGGQVLGETQLPLSGGQRDLLPWLKERRVNLLVDDSLRVCEHLRDTREAQDRLVGEK